MKILKTVLVILAVCTVGFLFLRRGFTEQKSAQFVGANSAVGPETVVPPSPVALIQSGEETDVPWTSRTPAAKRVRRIFPDSAWMTPEPVLKAGDYITLALFDDAVFDAELSNVTRYPNGAVGMTAHLRHGQEGTAYLSYCDGVMSASVEVMGTSDYAVEYRRDVDAYYAIEVDRANSQYFEGDEPKVPPAQDAALNAPVASGVVVSSTVSGAPANSTIIDVMVVYTPAARLVAGGTNGINNNITLAMQRANEAHTNSNTQVYLNFVHSAEVNYYESGTNFSLDLDRLTNTGDGYLEEVQTLRDTYKADVICLFESNSVSGGLGWLLTTTNGNPSHAFCLARVQQTSWTYTMVHEWGHNMGCGHSRTQVVEKGPGSIYTNYSAGWQWDDLLAQSTPPYNQKGYCTVMTYEDANNDKTNEYIRVARFSNPDINYIGASTNATGAANANNALVIRNTRTAIAAYREASDMDYDGLPNEWELQYFGGKTNANASAVASNGVNTVLEAYIAGLNPTNRTSFFKVNTFDPPAATNGGFVVGWSSVSGRVYSVLQTTRLQDSFQPLATNIVWPQASYTDTVHGAESGSFYKVKVQLAP